MSYFMTISGTFDLPPDMAPIELLPAEQAQPYIRDRESALAAADGGPVYLVHDGTTGTSHELIVQAEGHVQMQETLRGTALCTIIEQAVRSGCAFRIWWAGDGPFPPGCTECGSLNQVIRVMQDQIHGGADLAVAYRAASGDGPKAQG